MEPTQQNQNQNQNQQPAPVPAPAGQQDQGQQAQPEQLTPDGVRALIQEQLNPIAAALRRLGQPQKAPVPIADEDKAEKSWQSRLATLEAREAKATAKARATAIRQTGLAAGVDAERIDILLDHVERRHGSRIVVNEDTDSVDYVDEFGTPQPLQQFMSKLLSTPTGEMFKSAKRMPPAVKGTGQIPQGQPNRYTEMTYEQRQALSPDQRMALLKEAFLGGQQ